MKRPGGLQTQVWKKCSSCCCFNQVKVNCKPESSCSIFRPYWGSHSSRENKCFRILCSSQTSRMSPWSLLPCWEVHCFSEHNPCDPTVQVLLSHGEGWGVAGVTRKSNVQHSATLIHLAAVPRQLSQKMHVYPLTPDLLKSPLSSVSQVL